MAARLLDVAEPLATPVRPAVTFKTMTERYLKEKEISRKRTIGNDRKIIKGLLAYFGESTPLTEITAPRIAEYRITRLTTKSDKTGRTLEPGSVNRELSILRGLLRLAADGECGFLEKAPKVRLEREPQGRLRFLSDDESPRLLEECKRAAVYKVESCRSPYLYPIVVVALNTGMRKSEILNLEWDRINFSRGVVQLETTKNGTRREIPMNQAVYDVLSALPKNGPRLFPKSVRTAFEGALERAGVKNFHFHDLRHTFASRLTMNGRPLREVQELLGHKSIRMTERYSHLAPERLRDAVASLEVSTSSAQGSPQPAPIVATTR